MLHTRRRHRHANKLGLTGERLASSHGAQAMLVIHKGDCTPREDFCA
jgi:hypothetical protein